MRHLGREYQDRKGVDEARPNRLRDEAHEHAEAEKAEEDLDYAGEQSGGEKVGKAVAVDQRSRHEGDGAGRSRDHRGAAAGKGNDDADDEGGKQADLRIDAGREGKGDDFRNEGKGGNCTGQHFTRGTGRPVPAEGR